jgi:hypothetical protein
VQLASEPILWPITAAKAVNRFTLNAARFDSP